MIRSPCVRCRDKDLPKCSKTCRIIDNLQRIADKIECSSRQGEDTFDIKPIHFVNRMK